MESGTELPGQKAIDQAMTGHPVQAIKTGARDGNIEMRLSTTAKRLCPGMMGVPCTVIMNLELARCKFTLKDFRDPVPSAVWLGGGM